MLLRTILLLNWGVCEDLETSSVEGMIGFEIVV